MNISRTYKTVIVVALSVLIVSLLPGVAVVWAEVDPYARAGQPYLSGLIPAAQEERPAERPAASTDDMIIQVGPANAAKISAESDNSGVEIIPASAFSFTGELGNPNEPNDWFFHFASGYVRNDSANEMCLVAPVFLPPGSTIDSFTVYLVDNNAADVTFYLDSTSVTDGWVELGRVESTGSSSAIQTLTDPSIESTDGVNVVAFFAVNYYIDFCFPPNSASTIRVNGAQVNYTIPASTTGVYMPVLFKDLPPPPTTLFITNDTGGSLTYTAFGTPQGDVSCTIPAGAQDVACGTFSSGYYDWLVQTVCNPPNASGSQKYFDPPEKHLTPFFCRL